MDRDGGRRAVQCGATRAGLTRTGTICANVRHAADVFDGLTDDQIAEIFGWASEDVASICACYVDQTRVVVAIGKQLEKAAAARAGADGEPQHMLRRRLLERAVGFRPERAVRHSGFEGQLPLEPAPRLAKPSGSNWDR